MHTFDEAKAMAESNGMALIRHSKTHFQLRRERWIINLYPTTGTIYHDRNKPGPSIVVSKNWTLLEVVQHVVNAEMQNATEADWLRDMEII